jgi:hypothetical protein
MFGIDEDELLRSKRGDFSESRNVAIYLTRRLSGDSLKQIYEFRGYNANINENAFLLTYHLDRYSKSGSSRVSASCYPARGTVNTHFLLC